MDLWIQTAFSRPVVRRGLRFSVVVGLILIGINHGDSVLEGTVSRLEVIQMSLTFLVPYCVSVLSSVAAIVDMRRRAEGQSMGEFPDMNPGPVLQLGRDGEVIMANAAARRVFDIEEIIGASWFELNENVHEDRWRKLIGTGAPLHHEEQIGERTIVFRVAHTPGSQAVFAYGSDVTDLQAARRTLEEQASELRENALFPEMNPGRVVRLDLEGTVLRANRAALAAFGEDVVGRHWFDVVKGIDEEDWHLVITSREPVWKEVTAGETTIGYTMAHPEGSQYVFIYGTDITALKAAEREVADMAIFPEMNPGPVLRLDMEGRILLANKAARDIFHRSPLVGESWTGLCPAMSRARWDSIARSGERVNHETQIGDRHLLFTHGTDRERRQVFVYGTDLTDLKAAERALRQSEKMATLGTLAAGVAHELNNPAAAVQRAAEHLQKTFTLLQEAQIVVGRAALVEGELTTLGELDAAARERASHPPEFDPVTRSDRENDVEMWLEDHEIDQAWDLAPALVSLGYGPDELDELADGLQEGHLESVIIWMSRTYPVYSVLEEIRQGASRLSEIVGALKGYSFVGQAPVQSIDINEGIRQTLIILRSKLKHGVTVRLELDEELPRIQAYGGELNQVWTNLIDNAADAMGGTGTLTIRSARNGTDGVRVDVEDDGPGVPEHIQGRIFDPFFTTKEPGLGTGLGLNTTYNTVVKKHRGKIELESVPGRTRFTVILPPAIDVESSSITAEVGGASE